MTKFNLGTDLYVKGRIGWRGLSKSEYLKNSDYRIINATALMDGYVDWDNCGYITKERYEESNEIMLRENDILISKDGTLGKIGYVKGLTKATTVASGIFVLRNTIPNKLDFDYLYHILKSNIFKDFIFRNKAQGSTINHLYQRDLENFTLDLPPLDVQHKIAGILNAIDSKIENNLNIADNVDNYIKAIYEFWFLLFEYPDKEHKPYKTNGGMFEYNKVLNREIPKGWTVKELDKCVSTIIDNRGKTPKKLGGDWVEKGIKALSAKIVKGGRLMNLEQANQVSEEMFEKWMPDKLQDGDILMTSEAPLGEFYFMYIDTKYCLSQRLFAIRSKADIVLPIYLYYEMSDGHGYSQIIGKRSGSTVAGIRQNELRKVNILVPEKTIQRKFEEIVMPLIKKKRMCELETIKLMDLRKFILPMLMNGQIKP
jgi:type I restriction enzyme, S subunit